MVLSAVSVHYARVKKVLALVMAFAMAFTMMATAGAAYTDQADIEATEAVEMLNALGVMTGDPDGAFRPNDTITRAEACRMIYTIRTGTDDASSYANMQTTFTDVSSDAWYAGYVKHCQSVGIVSGRSATIFDPNSDVTAVELALMCLRVMGYDPATANIGGSTWSTTTIGLATEAGILDDVMTTITSSCPRQWAAQIMYNTILAPTVQWSTDTNSYTQYFDDGRERPTVGREYLDLWVNVGTVDEISGDNLTISMNASDTADSDNPDRKSFTSLDEDYSALLGQHVKVLYIDDKSNSVIGVYPTEDNTAYTVALKDIEQDGNKVKFDGASYSFDETKIDVIVVSAEDEEVKPVTTESAAWFDTEDNKTTPSSVTFIDSDGDGRLNTAVVTEFITAEVTYAGADRVTAGQTYRMDEDNVAEDFANGDWAAISYNMYDRCMDVAKADVVTTTAESYKAVDDDYHQYQLDGTWYNLTTAVYDDAGIATGDTVTAYIVNGVIVKLDADDGSGNFPTNIAVVVGVDDSADNSLNGDQVRIRLFDGTVKTVTISDRTAFTPSLGEAYRISGSDTAMRFVELNVDDTAKYNGYKYDGTGTTADPSNDKINSVVVDDNAAIILYDANGRSKIITGKQFNALTTASLNAKDDQDPGSETAPNTLASAVFTKEVNGLTRVHMAAVKVGYIGISGTSNDVYGYIVDSARETNGNTVYDLWTSDNKFIKGVIEENTYTADSRTRGTVIGFSNINSDNVIHDVIEIGNVFDRTAAVTDTIAQNITSFGTQNVYVGANMSEATDYISINGERLDVTADTKVLFVDSEETTEAAGVDFTYGTSTMVKAETNATTSARNVLFTVTTDTDELEVLVLDVTTAFDGFELENANSGNQGGVTGDDSYSNSEGNFTYSTMNRSLLTASGAAVNTANEVRFTVTPGTDVDTAGLSFTWSVYENGSLVQTANVIDLSQASNPIVTSGAGVAADSEIEIRLTNIKASNLGANASADAINNALANADGTPINVAAIPANSTIDTQGTNMTVGDGTTPVTLDGVTMSGDSTVEFDGETTFSGNNDLSGVKPTFDSNGATIGKGATAKFDANTGADGNIPTGTLTIAAGGTLTSEGTGADNTGAPTTFVGPADSGARIVTAENTTVKITFAASHSPSSRHTMTINGDATIPVGQTWYAMFDSETAAQGIDMIVNGNLTVDGTLALSSANRTGSKLTLGDNAKVTIGAGGVMDISAWASVDADATGASIVGTDATSQLKVTAAAGGATITGIAGVTNHNEGSYTWNTNTWATGA